MIGLLRVILFIGGTLAVIVGAVAAILGVLAAINGAVGSAAWQFALAAALLWAGTLGTTRLDKKLKARRDRRRTIDTQESEFV